MSDSGARGRITHFERFADVLVRRAAAIRAKGGLNYAYAFAAGAASMLDCPVLTGDPELRVVEDAGVTVGWLPRPTG